MHRLIILSLFLPFICRSADASDTIDGYMNRFIIEHRVPGASVAISRDGKLLYAKGYGWADKKARAIVKPNSLFRIASISKPITAVAIMQLVESGKLNLTDCLVDHLESMEHYRRHEGYDPRIEDITIHDLLRHSGGWDRSKDFDPMGREGHLRVAKMGIYPPVETRDVIAFMFRRPLQFDPGTRSAYSNFGYLLLGRVIEDVTGKKYEPYVKRYVLAPLGITTMQVGFMERERRAENEVTYYDHKHRTAPAPYGRLQGREVPYPYARPMQFMDAHGGWIASAPDLVRFADNLHKLLKPETIQTMFARQPGLLGHDANAREKAAFYALGWMVRPQANGANHWHGGLIQGTSTLLVRRHDGYRWAILFNTSSNPENQTLSGLIDGPFHGLVSSVDNWTQKGR
ncbi:MAG: serine hydrolase domain-containing protein [Limisphaerales bacterium]